MSRFLKTISQSVCAISVLSLVCTSIAVANPTAAVPATATTVAAAAPTSTTATTATATDSSADLAQGGPLSDVPQGHWAYDAVAQLVKDGLIKGYPDGQFKGNRPMTRYEAAVLTYRAVDQIEAQITAGKAVEQADLDAVKKLMAAFGKELKDVETHVDALDKQYKDLKTEADATRTRVNQGRIGFQIEERPGTAFTQTEVINGGNTIQLGATPGQQIGHNPASSLTAPLGTNVSFGTGAFNTTPIGPLAHGVNYTIARFILGGQIDPRWSYGVRVSDRLQNENGLGNTVFSPSFCTVTTTTNCTFSDLSNFGSTYPLNLDYGYLQYSSPGGITSQFGRYSVGAYGRYNFSPTGFIFSGQQITGANLGYNDPHGHIFAQGYYGIPFVSSYQLQTNGNSTTQNVCSPNIIGLNQGPAVTSFTDINPFCNNTPTELGGWAFYWVGKPAIGFGGAIDTFVNKQYTFYNPNAVNCSALIGGPRASYQAVNAASCLAFPGATLSTATPGNYLTELGNLQLAEVYFRANFGPAARPTVAFEAAAARHLGNNPFDPGRTFTQANAYNASLTYASKGNIYSTGSNDNPFYAGGGRANSNVIQLQGEWYGLNSVGGIDTGNYTGTQAQTNNTGLSNPNGLFDYGVEVGHWFSDSVRFSLGAFHVQNNANIPVGTNGTANTTCAGCFVNFVQQNQLNAEMYLYFF